MPVTSGGARGTSGRETCAGVDLRALAEAARVEVATFTRGQSSLEAELFLTASRRLSLEYEARTGDSTLARGESLWGAGRVWRGEESGFAALPVGGPEDLRRVLGAATRRLGVGSRAPGLVSPPPAGPWPPELPELSAERMSRLAEQLARTVVPPGVVVQAEVLAQSATWTALVRGEGIFQTGLSSREEAFVRCETSRGAVVDAVASPSGDAWDLAALRARLTEAVEALEGPAEAVSPGLPLVLRPAVAAPLVAGLAWLLRGDVAASSPALARAVGKKAFPSVLSVEDGPLHPLGTQRRETDDEGLFARRVRLVDEGRLVGFLHSAATAARLGVEPNGRGLRSEASPPAPSPLNLFVVPRGDALPERYTELVARIETFTTMPRPGLVTLVAGGWEVEAGRRVRRINPVELSLPVLETFRALRGVGTDLAFFPTAEGCGTPTLVLPPLLSG
ncbi:TldD/PmbA family protein [Archangium violaceum]|uniref:metallopeptidase TldD-related protein n=1 Tax=Archangium violaceum TaxID=83451 RepID=UPI00194F9E82|nr:metallopeptidase TldD-related protein [Archangium violaceum]QRN95004.1 TldD/PmbA family protein [Archangium violaceum]